MQQLEDEEQNPLKEHQIIDSYCIISQEIETDLGDFQLIHIESVQSSTSSEKSQSSAPNVILTTQSVFLEEPQIEEPDQASFDALFVNPKKLDHENLSDATFSKPKENLLKSPPSLGLGFYALSLFKETYKKSKMKASLDPKK
jgi:hypothetical protein